MDCGNAIDFDYWSKIQTIEVWEAAAMMWRKVDPRALSMGEIADKYGDVPNLSDEERQLISAVRAGSLVISADCTGQAPSRHTHILTKSLIGWFRVNGHAEVADGLEHAGAIAVPTPLAEAKRRLDRLRSLGGSCAFDSMSGKWKTTGLKHLKSKEAEEGTGRTSEKTLRRDLISAAEAEREELRTGQRSARSSDD
ncbi:MAG TPA: hypothetical protein PK306_21290 [Aquabacterium sp.]|nr:hypothetical protein [Aquabacterium sp.]HQC98239.1 hypothetical protein [Aquabacterium sp.]